MIIELVKILFVFGLVMGMVPILVYAERRISAGIQGRLGPNRVGPFGLLQPIADMVKLMFKEDLVPRDVDRPLHTIAPLLVFIPPALVFSVIPFGNKIQIAGREVTLQIADLNIGILFALAILSMSVYGLAFGGWASNNKYSLMGGVRSSAQMISYELILGLTVVTVIMVSGSVRMQEIVMQQSGGVLDWNIFRLPLGFLLFFIAAFAENNRLPFDLPEAEPELVAGYHTEYSGMKFSLFFMGEYIAMVTMSAIMVTLFLGGWSMPGLVDPHSSSLLGGLLSVGVFVIKMCIILFIYIWVRWTLPRFRWIDLMQLGWKVLLPLALINLMVTGVVLNL
jgi:NADH-quinone oxidoreductase subunit H